jgi:8-oxo-dGTP pyrophosphatase MutT (NUDIX family)
MNELENKIGKILEKKKVKNIINNELTRAAVLIPLYKKEKEYSILFTKRLKTLKRHAGQISFPGGIFEDNDKDLKITAIRETCEELGIKRKNIKVLGRLDDMVTSTGYLISPFAGILNSYKKLKINREEIDELISVPLLDLMKMTPRAEIWTVKDSPYPVYYYDYGKWVIWGATAKILKNFLEITSKI